jgi:hypothetical protein
MNKFFNNFGTTGMMIPHPVISISKVINMKPIAAFFFEFSMMYAKIIKFKNNDSKLKYYIDN